MRDIIVPVVLATACGFADERLFPVPKADETDRIVVSDGTGRGPVIKDPKRIERLLEFLKTRKDGWQSPWYTFPVPQQTIRLEKSNGLVKVLWLGPNWIGGRGGSGGPSNCRLRPLSGKDRTELLNILDIQTR